MGLRSFPPTKYNAWAYNSTYEGRVIADQSERFVSWSELAIGFSHRAAMLRLKGEYCLCGLPFSPNGTAETAGQCFFLVNLLNFSSQSGQSLIYNLYAIPRYSMSTQGEHKSCFGLHRVRSCSRVVLLGFTFTSVLVIHQFHSVSIFSLISNVVANDWIHEHTTQPWTQHSLIVNSSRGEHKQWL